MPASVRRLRAARRHRRNLHPSRREHPRRHLHVDLGSADGGVARPQAGGRRWSASTTLTARRSSPTCSAARCARRSRRGSARAGCACLLPVAEIRGQQDPDEFLLVHGHYDSWYEGIGDNATGDAALLELARVLWTLRDRLKRSVRIAWWPGHSTGRYAGSTWYADTFADEIDEHCIAQLDIDSPGCADATAYEEVMWMAEADALCRSSIQDALGLGFRARPAAARRRLLVQPDRPDGPVHAAVEHSRRGAHAPRLLRGRRLRRQHRLAHAWTT